MLVELADRSPLPEDENLCGGVIEQAIAGIAAVDLGSVLAQLDGVVSAVAATFGPREGGPAGCEVKFGIKIGAGGRVIVAKMDGEVNLEVKLTWMR